MERPVLEWKRNRLPPLKPPHQLPQRCLQRPADVAQLDQVQPPLPGLVLADEGLRPAQPLGHLDLPQAGFLPQLPQQRHQTLVLRAPKGLLHHPE